MSNDKLKPVLGADERPQPEPDLDRKARFAQRASVSVRSVDNWIHDRRIPFLKVGGTVLIPWREALDHLRRNYGINARGEERRNAR